MDAPIIALLAADSLSVPRTHTMHRHRHTVRLKLLSSLPRQSVLVANCCENLSVICP
jgi:hypothetical protein